MVDTWQHVSRFLYRKEAAGLVLEVTLSADAEWCWNVLRQDRCIAGDSPFANHEQAKACVDEWLRGHTRH